MYYSFPVSHGNPKKIFNYQITSCIFPILFGKTDAFLTFWYHDLKIGNQIFHIYGLQIITVLEFVSCLEYFDVCFTFYLGN